MTAKQISITLGSIKFIYSCKHFDKQSMWCKIKGFCFRCSGFSVLPHYSDEPDNKVLS